MSLQTICTLSNVFSNYFLYKHNFKTKGYAGYTVSGVINSTPNYLTVPLQNFLENLGI